MKANDWIFGPPPSLGWWPVIVAAFPPDDGKYRLGWWDGVAWSTFAQQRDSAKTAAEKAKNYGCFSTDDICYKPRPSYWPTRSKT